MTLSDVFPLFKSEQEQFVPYSRFSSKQQQQQQLLANELWEPFIPLDSDSSILGKGTYGLVSCVRHVPTKKILAVKSINKATVVSCGMTQQVENEIRFQMMSCHSNILRSYCCLEDDYSIHLFMERCDGDLYSKLKLRPTRKFQEDEAFIYFAQLVNGLHYLHSMGFFHRDLKLENLLLSFDNTLKIADFGWVAIILGIQNNFNFCGTLDYLAPEMIQGHGHDWRVDLWGAGILLYEMLVGSPPFHALDSRKLVQNILEHRISFPSWVAPDAKQLIGMLLQPIPENRIALAEIVHTPWALRMWCRIPKSMKTNPDKNQISNHSDERLCTDEYSD